MVLLYAGGIWDAARAPHTTADRETYREAGAGHLSARTAPRGEEAEEKYRAAEGRTMNISRRAANCRMKRASSRNDLLWCVDRGGASARTHPAQTSFLPGPPPFLAHRHHSS
ncbi:MAG TPA: hypothetical protein ENN68_09455 [Methanomicrobia archaeon]|nr:hypothetical protein [Methanomicrobia archaeon]